MDARVQDYLDDKLQTPTDLENLDALLQTLQEQQALLKKQLHEANDTLRSATDESADHTASLQSAVQIFSNSQDDLDHRLLYLTQSQTSDEAVAKFEASLETLGRLELAAGYLDLLQEVETLSTSARQNLRSTPGSAVPAYSRLRGIAAALKEAQPAAEGAAPHLIDHVDEQTTTVWEQMRSVFDDDLQKVLDSLQWPNKDLRLDPHLVAQWSSQVGRMLDLQEPDLPIRHAEMPNKSSSSEPVVLLPLQVMVRPLALRFRYHFLGDKATNRLDKPEYFLTHTIDLLETHNDFMLDYLQPILDRRYADAQTDVNLAYTDTMTAFITALLPMVRQKCLTLLPQIANDPHLLSHFIHELLEFDSTLRDTWAYTPFVSALDTWKGLTWEMLVTHGYFDDWLQGEKSFALNRYQTIISSADSGEIDYDSELPGATKPTKGAMRVNDLLETITDRYRPLISFSQKLRFLIDIQLEIFDLYHRRLHDSLEAYLTMTSAIGRRMQGSAGKDTAAGLSGVKGLDRLCRVFGSAEYLEKKMLDWSDDVFFLELWDELQDRARKNLGTGRSVAGDLSMSHIASKTSAAVAHGDSLVDAYGESDGGALFDETASAYQRIRTRSEEIIIETLTSNVRRSLAAYSQVSTWASLTASGLTDTAGESASTNLSPELSGPLQLIDSQLGFIASVLSKAPLRRVARQLCLAIQTYLWERILMVNSFSAGGAAIFQTDIQAIWTVIDRTVGPGVGQSGMAKLSDGMKLLCLTTSAPNGASLTVKSSQDDDGWGFADEDAMGEDSDGPADGAELPSDDSEESSMGASQARKWGLWEVERRIFRSNDSARLALRHLGIEGVGEREAREVLERRVELQK